MLEYKFTCVDHAGTVSVSVGIEADLTRLLEEFKSFLMASGFSIHYEDRIELVKYSEQCGHCGNEAEFRPKMCTDCRLAAEGQAAEQPATTWLTYPPGGNV